MQQVYSEPTGGDASPPVGSEILQESITLLKFSLKKVVSLSRGHVAGNTHLNFGFSQGGLNYRASRMQSNLLELLRRSR